MGARLTTTYGDKSSFMSVDEQGTRFALIDRHVKKLVRVYTLDVPREEELSLPEADRASIEKFAKWLDPRPLTPQECVEYQVKYDPGCR